MRAAGIRAAISVAWSRSSASYQVKTAEDLLGVRERPVGDQRLPVLDADGGRGLDRMQGGAADHPGQLPDIQVLPVVGFLLIRAERLGGPGLA